MGNIIVITQDGIEPELWSNFLKVCSEKGWKYSTLSKKKMPIEHKGVKIYRKKVQKDGD